MRLLAEILVAFFLLTAWPVGAAESSALPSREEVQSAARKTAADKNLPGTEKSKSLRFKKSDEKPDTRKDDLEGMRWLVDFVKTAVETARILVWLLAALAIALLVVGVRRWIKVRGDAALPRRGVLPSHVQSLDIRPESLPADIGRAAAGLWERGEQLGALSLLYRGALSRLVHGYAVPIRAASTEGECVVLAEKQLDAGAGLFFARLVTAWQLAVYGARLPQGDDVMALCRDFDQHLQVRAAVRGAST